MHRPYLLRVADSLSQLANTVLLLGEPDESVSGRCYRRGVLDGARRWRCAMRVIDWLFSRWERQHCRLAHEADLQRARERLGLQPQRKV